MRNIFNAFKTNPLAFFLAWITMIGFVLWVVIVIVSLILGTAFPSIAMLIGLPVVFVLTALALTVLYSDEFDAAEDQELIDLYFPEETSQEE